MLLSSSFDALILAACTELCQVGCCAGNGPPTKLYVTASCPTVVWLDMCVTYRKYLYGIKLTIVTTLM